MVRDDLDFLLACDFESMKLEQVIYNSDPESMESSLVTEDLSVLIIWPYFDDEDHQYLLVRFINDDGTRGFGELSYMPVGGGHTMRYATIERHVAGLKENGRALLHRVAEGIRSGEFTAGD
jgi:hypothetical protein